jgi:type II secretory pathway pseudopilin PulG
MRLQRQDEAGGLLVEALIALMVLSVTVVGVLDVLLAARDAEARSDLRREASWVLRSTAVLARSSAIVSFAATPSDGELTSPRQRVVSTQVVEDLDSGWYGDKPRCGPTGVPSRTIGVRPAGDRTAPDLLPPSTVSPRVGRQLSLGTNEEPRLWLSLVDRTGAPHAGVTLLIDRDTVPTEIVVTDASGCAVLTSATSGAVRARVGGDLTDGPGRLSGDTGLAIDLLERDQRVRWILEQSVDVRVTVLAPPGAILPSTPATTLWWGVLGSAQVVPVDGVQSLPWWSGSGVATIGACPSPIGDATAQSSMFDGMTLVGVVLPTVRVEGVDTVAAPVITARRASTCPGATWFRPVLQWPGPHTAVVTIALPNGVWDLSLESATGGLLSGPVTIASGAPDATVRFYG